MTAKSFMFIRKSKTDNQIVLSKFSIPALSEINIKIGDTVGILSEFGVIPCSSEKTEYPNKIFLRDLEPFASEIYQQFK